MRDNYKLAVEYGMLVLEFGKKSQCVRIIARTYTYLGSPSQSMGSEKQLYKSLGNLRKFISRLEKN
ncbi:hypothetical protein [Sporofaciens musculi]|uniref:hypothetical protein n=1 Tax=Sporofaciens musculi TaxID=2681861 RepID=UPI002584D25F|nr:hypothetical protein [Sporofaciens musculi]